MSTLSISHIEMPPCCGTHLPQIKHSTYRLYGMLLWLGLCFSQPLFAQFKEYPLTIPTSNHYYIGGLALDGNRAVVVADSGVFVFEYQGKTWKRTASLNRSDPFRPSEEMFVAISGNRIALVSYNNLYVYQYNGTQWLETAKLTCPGGGGDYFYIDSHPIDIDGNRIIAMGYNDNQNLVYVYDYNGSTWLKTHDIEEPQDVGFGAYLALSADQLVVSGTSDSDNSNKTIVYEFNGSDWIQTAKLTYDVNIYNAARGVDIDHNRIALNGESGYCKIYEKSGSEWIQTATLTPTDGIEGYYDSHGYFVSLSGNAVAFTIVPGFPLDYANLICVFEYDGNQWIERANVLGYENIIRIELSGKNLLMGGLLKVIDLGSFSNAKETKIIAPDGQANAEFGGAIATTTTTYSINHLMIIGAPHDSEKGTDAGAAYIYKREGTTWKLMNKITALDASPGDQFGASVFISDGYAIVGAPFDDDKGQDAGAAYRFRYDEASNQYVQYQKLTASDGAAGDQFGTAVFNIAVGAPYHDSEGIVNSGAVYIYPYNNSERKITPAHPKRTDLFGSSLHGRDFNLIVGSPRDDEKAHDAGAAFIFTNISTNPILKVKLTAHDGADFDRFGTSVAIEDFNAVVGAPLDDDAGNESGSAYVFHTDFYIDDEGEGHYSDWYEKAKLTASDAKALDRFGNSVAVDGKKVAVGASYADHRGTNAGAAYVFAKEEDTWTEKGKLTGKARTGDRLGSSVAFYERQVMVGAYHDDDPVKGKDAGSVYVFNIYNLSDLPVTSAPLARINDTEQPTKEQLEQVEAIKNPLSGIKEMKIYPNPFAERLSIVLDQEQAQPVEITLLDQLGRTLYHKAFTAEESQQLLAIDLSQEKTLSSGLLFLGLKTQQGNSQWIRLLKK